MKSAGTTEFHMLSDEERAKWVAALKPVYDEVAGRVGADLISAMQKASAGQ
jgi:C4-dicarboxylate-binding protein DctP